MKTKIMTLMLSAVLLASTVILQAKPKDAPPAGCRSWDQISTKMIEHCALAGGYLICDNSGTALCCKDKAGGGRTCSDDPGSLSRPRPGKIQDAPTTNQLPDRPKPRPPINNPNLNQTPNDAASGLPTGKRLQPVGSPKASDGGSKDPSNKK